ncbi:hypothetical protein Val02_82250 [Virgisporangium aliadipatigenens]|uniref:Uncharacterized protein n=1 Tax=Virgisporangium aliadipatigenens TaxID=741659 RepID=A0A8J4DV07_9ACTN|nr:hypothetical protein [Virgisporangium aliadipatigenens]GIJ51339.1 hypothetical protein Val02_82250 [Virgisporangium aliadipatigenens]
MSAAAVILCWLLALRLLAIAMDWVEFAQALRWPLCVGAVLFAAALTVEWWARRPRRKR